MNVKTLVFSKDLNICQVVRGAEGYIPLTGPVSDRSGIHGSLTPKTSNTNFGQREGERKGGLAANTAVHVYKMFFHSVQKLLYRLPQRYSLE